MLTWLTSWFRSDVEGELRVANAAAEHWENKAGELTVDLHDLKKENARLEDVAERRREAVERIAAERDKAFDDLKECRKQLLDALERHRSAVEGRNKRDERLCLAAEVLNDAVREFGSKRITN